MSATVSRSCEKCGTEFFVKPSRVAQGKARFCSLACRHAAPSNQNAPIGPHLTQRQAIAFGAMFYLGRDCKGRHGGIRYTSSAACRECSQEKTRNAALKNPRVLLSEEELRDRRIERQRARRQRLEAAKSEAESWVSLPEEIAASLEMLPKNPTAARKIGAKFYMSEAACPKDHVSPRYTNGGRCVLCTQEANAIKIGKSKDYISARGLISIHREAAMNNGMGKYHSDRPCPKGHFERFTASNNCVQCQDEAREKSKEKRAWDRIRKIYGLDKVGYQTLEESQNGLCAICNESLADSKSHIDHCHSTGKVRGILCGPCNQGIGLLREDTKIMRQAINYIELHKGEIQ